MIPEIPEDVDLQDVGEEGTLHVTVVAGGAVQILTLIVMTGKAHAGIPAEEVVTKTTWLQR